MESERAYLQRRAGEEQAAAERATTEKARDLHAELAARYRDAAGGQPPPRTPDPASSKPGRPLDFVILE